MLTCVHPVVPPAKPETPTSTIEAAFQEYTERNDIAIVLINQHIAEKIRPTMEAYTLPFPAILEIPSKEQCVRFGLQL